MPPLFRNAVKKLAAPEGAQERNEYAVGVDRILGSASRHKNRRINYGLVSGNFNWGNK
jgi:hypothetical protein